MPSRPLALPFLSTVAAVAAGLALAWVWWFVVDDAYISFRYARHLVDGVGLRYNPSEDPPVEGYSNLGWVLLAAAVLSAGGAPEVALPWVSWTATAGLCAWTGFVARRRFGASEQATAWGVASVALAPQVVVWSTGGLATLPAALALAVLVDGWVFDRTRAGAWRGAAAAVVLGLLRTEGFAWAVAAGVIGAWTRGGATRRALAGPAVVVAGIATGWLVWKLDYHHGWLANTAAAKLVRSPEGLGRGVAYVVGQGLADLGRVGAVAATVAWASRARTPRAAAVVAFAAAPAVLAVAVGGDFMAFGRLLVPSVAFLGVGVAGAVDAFGSRGRALAAAVVALGLLPLADVHPVPAAVRARFEERHNTPAFRSEAAQWGFMRDNARRWAATGRALAEIAHPGDSLVTGAIGAVGYHAGVVVYDRFGLVSPAVLTAAPGDRARSPGHDRAVPPTFFLDQAPTWLAADLLWGDPVRAARRHARRLRGLAPDRYAPVLHRSASGRWLLVHARTDDPAAAWAAFDARVMVWEGLRGRGRSDAAAEGPSGRAAAEDSSDPAP